MKHLKTYEGVFNKFEVGDYVMCLEKSDRSEEFNTFLENNIGLIIGIY